jgi:hypothetical protein
MDDEIQAAFTVMSDEERPWLERFPNNYGV